MSGSGEKRKAQWKHQYEKTKRRNAFFKSIFGCSSHAFVCTDKDGIIEHVNDAWVTLTGYGGDECCGKTCALLQCDDTSPETKQMIREKVRRNQRVECTVLNKKKDGTLFWNQLRIVPLEQGFCAEIQEVTLEFEPLGFSMMHETPGVGTFILRFPECIIEYVSNGILDITGFHPIHYKGKCCPSTLHPEDTKKCWSFVHTMEEKTEEELLKHHFNMEYRRKHKDGTYVWVSTTGGFKKWNGQMYVLCQNVSIHEQKRLQRTNQHLNKFLLDIADKTETVIMKCTLDGVLTYVSPACETLYGYTPTELIGTNGWSYVHPDDIITLKAVERKHDKKLTCIKTEFRRRHKNGTYVKVCNIACTDPDGEEYTFRETRALL